MLNHVREELEVVQVAEGVHGVIQGGERYEDIHKIGEGCRRKVVSVHLKLVKSGMKPCLELWRN